MKAKNTNLFNTSFPSHFVPTRGISTYVKVTEIQSVYQVSIFKLVLIWTKKGT